MNNAHRFLYCLGFLAIVTGVQSTPTVMMCIFGKQMYFLDRDRLMSLLEDALCMIATFLA